MQRSCLGESPPPPRQLHPSPALTGEEEKGSGRKPIQQALRGVPELEVKILVWGGERGAEATWRA